MTILLGCSISEAVCGVWIARSHRNTVVPTGGIEPEDPTASSIRFATPPAGVPLRTEFPDAVSDPQIDLVVVGESSAEGVPYNRWVSIGKIIAWKLEQAIPGRHVRLDVVARSGDTLERQHQALSNIQRRPEILLIYCGHNEFYSRLWWARNLDHYHVQKSPAAWSFLDKQMSECSAVCALIRETSDRCRIAIPPDANTGRHLVDVANYTATEYRLLLSDFRRRLNELALYAKQVGAIPILISPPGNDRDFEPNRSFLPPSTPAPERARFERDFLAVQALETNKPRDAIAGYRGLIAAQPCFAESHYRLGRLLEDAGDWDEAYREYVAAHDLDGMPMRCLSPFQAVYREVADAHGCLLIDGQAYFHAIGRHGLLDDALFQDAMHPSLRGQIALAQAVLVALHARHAFGWPLGSPIPHVDPTECASHFGIGKDTWRMMALWRRGFNDLTWPLRYDPSLRLKKREAAAASVALLANGATPDSLGFANVGIPAAVPVVPDIGSNRGPVERPADVDIMPCIGGH